MSRIPVAEWLRLADQVQPVESFADKVAVVSRSIPRPLAALITLHHEAVALVNLLAVLVDRGGNSVLIDEAAIAVQRWNRSLHEAAVMVKKQDILTLAKSSPTDSTSAGGSNVPGSV